MIGEEPQTEPDGCDWLIGCQVRSGFFVTFPRALSQALCSACALVSAAVVAG
jgi:hypothetical protein